MSGAVAARANASRGSSTDAAGWESRGEHAGIQLAALVGGRAVAHHCVCVRVTTS